MDPYFRELLEGLRHASVELLAANRFLLDANVALVGSSGAMQRASDAVVKATTGALQAKDEHGDLRETVTRLEATVLELVREVKALRRNGGAA